MRRKLASEKLLDAMEQALLKTPLSRVTVEDLINAAGVSKTTFYRNYLDKYDLACRLYDSYYDPLEQDFREKSLSFRDFFYKACYMIRDNKQLFESLFDEPFSQNSVYIYHVDKNIEVLKKYIDESLLTEEKELELYISVNGMVYVAWSIMQGKLQKDFDRSMETLLNLTLEKFNPIIKK